jgi:hypothetical protein
VQEVYDVWFGFVYNDVKIVSVLARVMARTTDWRIIFSYFVDI